MELAVKALDSKSSVGQFTVGSNPTPSDMRGESRLEPESYNKSHVERQRNQGNCPSEVLREAAQRMGLRYGLKIIGLKDDGALGTNRNVKLSPREQKDFIF